jgi:hypothetical protein
VPFRWFWSFVLVTVFVLVSVMVLFLCLGALIRITQVMCVGDVSKRQS